MPGSHTYQQNEIMELVILTNPKAILDVGCGFGKFGVLCFERLNYWYMPDGKTPVNDYKNRNVVIDAVEAFSEYITPVHEYVYNTIYINNINTILEDINKKYDLVLLIDVLEHFTREEGERVIKKFLQISRNIIISTPKNIGVQKDSFGNKFEEHKTQWCKEDFVKFGNYFVIKNPFSYIVYLGKDLERVRSSSCYFREVWK